MLNRADYRKLRDIVKKQIENQKLDGFSFIAISNGLIETIALNSGIRCFNRKDWPRLIAQVAGEVGLVDDGTHTGTWTIPEHVSVIQDVVKELRGR